MTQDELAVKHANQQYTLKVEQELEIYTEALKKRVAKAMLSLHADDRYGGHYHSHTLTDAEWVVRRFDLPVYMKYVCLAKMNTFFLYFTFGKYKGRIVQDIMYEDENYCSWFAHEVRGQDFNTLKILDYLSKYLYHGLSKEYDCVGPDRVYSYFKYWLQPPEAIFEQVLTDIPEEIRNEVREIKNEVLKTFRYEKDSSYGSNSYEFDDISCDPEDVAPFSGLNELGYGDLC